eukprot:TRINITY_DN84268_c0_g1_i1.p1 TRINITY_DN84268_c0_g1~~TRINITY_DN84268_c0_g1_i1.p1  ORF type:complete len:269 (+),score=13.07 TRINITY_DN84268_c0_g1_i1:92-898(+)
MIHNNLTTCASPVFPEAIQSYFVSDQLNKANTIQVNKKNVFFTLGKSRYQPGEPGELCQRFHQGNCPLGARCPRMHVQPKFVREKRTAAENCLKCCTIHDGVGHRKSETRPLLIRQEQDGVYFDRVLPVGCISQTKALDSLDKSSQFVVIEPSALCRLHRNSKCTFGHKCSHIHLCREIYKQYYSDDCDSDTLSEGDSSDTQSVDSAQKPSALSEPSVLDPVVFERTLPKKLKQAVIPAGPCRVPGQCLPYGDWAFNSFGPSLSPLAS